MSLPEEQVLSILKKHFVVGWKNIAREDYVGSSHGYGCTDTAVGTTNGAGPRNTQMFILSPDGVVLHCLPGFWHPDDLVGELNMGRTLYRLWKDKRSPKAKRDMFTRIQMTSLKRQPRETYSRSGWQGFDASNERDRLKKGPRDTFYYVDGKPGRIKPLNVLVHERMAARPFKRFQEFDTDVFVDYGRPYYDNNARVDGRGVNFGTKGYMASQKRMAERAKKRAEKKRKVDEYYGKKPKGSKATDAKKMMRGKSKPKPKKSKRKPTSRPTSRPSRRKA